MLVRCLTALALLASAPCAWARAGESRPSLPSADRQASETPEPSSSADSSPPNVQASGSDDATRDVTKAPLSAAPSPSLAEAPNADDASRAASVTVSGSHSGVAAAQSDAPTPQSGSRFPSSRSGRRAWRPVSSGATRSRETLGAADPASDEGSSAWYGWKNLIVDGAGIVTMPILLGFGVYALGSPIVHIAEGEGWRAAGSLGLRLAVPLALAYLMTEPGHTECEESQSLCCSCGGAIAGGALGMLIAIAIDDFALARHSAPEPNLGAVWTVAPSVAVSRDGTRFALLGSF